MTWRYRHREEGKIRTDVEEVVLESVECMYWVGM